MFIAEIGINHNGNLDIAKKLIYEAKNAGVDVVKFQKRNPDVCVPEERKNDIKGTPWGTMTYLEYKKKIEFEKKEYDEIDKYCKEIGIKWTASVWDLDSLNFILQYNIPFIKIPSACITDKELLIKTKESKMPVIISTGMSTQQEVNEALKILQYTNLTVMHCNSSYPSKENELDLNVIKEWANVSTIIDKDSSEIEIKSNFKIGYSGHEEGIMPTIIAKSLGAEVIERHITLDKNMWGSDHKASLDINELKELINYLNKIPIWLGKDEINVYPSEEKIKQKLRRI
ncbi:MAG: N-acetylneuraminate synthase family protein [archaeon]